MDLKEEKLQAVKLWTENPCGVGDYVEHLEYGSRAFFDEIRRNRYEVTDDWMPRHIDFGAARGAKLLEIGYGLGTDLLTFRENGAEVYGIDITEEHHRLAQLNFTLHGQDSVLSVGDCAKIDYPSDYFDFVYSHGVLHHTPEIDRCISEVHRVLKQGGQFIMSVYHTLSAYHICTMLINRGLIRGKLFRLGYRGLMATVERGADGVTTKPLVKTYRKGSLRRMLDQFATVELRCAHFKREHIPRVGRLLPRSAERDLEPYLGWYLLAFATK